MNPQFTRPQAILRVLYMTFFFQANSIKVILKKYPGSSKLYDGNIRVFETLKSAPIIIKAIQGLMKAFWGKAMCFCKKNIHIYNFINYNHWLPVIILDPAEEWTLTRRLKNPSLHFRRPSLTFWSYMDCFYDDWCAFWGFKRYHSLPL